MKKPVRRIIERGVGLSISAAVITAGAVALLHMLETPQLLKSTLPGEPSLYVWRKRSIFYKVLGAADAPPLVLLHTPDIGASAHEMQQIMEPLARTYRVYAPDLLGFGLSDRPSVEYDAEMYNELCRDFIHEVVKQPAVFVASGLSCNYAVSVASRHPELCTGVVLISPLVLRGDPEQPRLWRNVADKPLSKAVLYPLLSTRLAFWLTHLPAGTWADFAQFYATTHQLGAQHAAMALVAGKLVQDASCEFEALQRPVLLIWGAQALEDQRNLASLHEISQLRRAREVEIIQGAGLAVHVEQPESVVAAIQRWASCAQLPAPLVLPEQERVVEVQPPTDSVAEVVRVARPQTELSRSSQAREFTPKDLSNVGQAEPAEQQARIPTPMSRLAYCVKCKTKTEMLHASEFTMKNGRAALRGTCAICGSSITRLGGLQYPE